MSKNHHEICILLHFHHEKVRSKTIQIWNRNIPYDAVEKAEPFINSILPELVGKWFTKQVSEHEAPQQFDDEEQDRWCYCKKDEDYGAMIGCDNNVSNPLVSFFISEDDTKSSL